MIFLHILHVCFRPSAECWSQSYWPQTYTDLSQLKIWLTKWRLKKALKVLRMRFIVLALEHRKAISFPRTPASSFKHINWKIPGHTILVTLYIWSIVTNLFWVYDVCIWLCNFGRSVYFQKTKKHIKIFCAVTVIIK